MTLNRKGLNATLPDYQRLEKKRVASATTVEVARKERPQSLMTGAESGDLRHN